GRGHQPAQLDLGLDEPDGHRQAGGREQLLPDPGEDLLRRLAVEQPLAECAEEVCLLDVLLPVEDGHEGSSPVGAGLRPGGPRASRARGRRPPIVLERPPHQAGVPSGTWSSRSVTQSAWRSSPAWNDVVTARQRHPAALAAATPATASSTTRQAPG